VSTAYFTNGKELAERLRWIADHVAGVGEIYKTYLSVDIQVTSHVEAELNGPERLATIDALATAVGMTTKDVTYGDGTLHRTASVHGLSVYGKILPPTEDRRAFLLAELAKLDEAVPPTVPKLTAEEDDELHAALGSAYYNLPDPAAFVAGMRASQADGTLDFDPTVAAGLRELEKAEPDGAESLAPFCAGRGCGHSVQHHDEAHGCMCHCRQFVSADPTPVRVSDERVAETADDHCAPYLNTDDGLWSIGDRLCVAGTTRYHLTDEGAIAHHNLALATLVPAEFNPGEGERVAEIRCDEIALTLNQSRANNATQTEIDEYIRALPEFGRVEREDICDEIRVFDLADGTRFIKAAGKSYSEPTWKWSR